MAGQRSVTNAHQTTASPATVNVPFEQRGSQVWVLSWLKWNERPLCLFAYIYFCFLLFCFCPNPCKPILISDSQLRGRKGSFQKKINRRLGYGSVMLFSFVFPSSFLEAVLYKVLCALYYIGEFIWSMSLCLVSFIANLSGRNWKRFI